MCIMIQFNDCTANIKFLLRMGEEVIDIYSAEFIAEYGRKQKWDKLLLSRRSTLYPCCVPTLGEFKRSWP